MRELDQYGPAIRVYEGVGFAVAETGEEVAVYFDARQRQDSTIIVGCLAQSGTIIPREVREIRGTTTDHDAIRIEGGRVNLHSAIGGSVPFMIYAFSRMHVSHIYHDWPIEIVTCALANFIFDIRELSIPPDPFEMTFHGYQITVEPVGNYTDVYGLLRAAGGIHQTATAKITPGTHERIEEAALPKLLFALCHPLSLARSTRVTWLWYRAGSTSPAGDPRPHHTYHTASIALPFTMKGAVSGFTADVPTLVQAWGNDLMQRLLPLDDVVPRLAQYHEAVREGAFAEAAGLAAATLLDVLANGHAVAKGRTATIREDVWKQYIAPELRKALVDMLARLPHTSAESEPPGTTATRAEAIEAIKALDNNQREALAQRLYNEWRTTFRSRLGRLMKDLKVECDFTEDVLATRNRLVHDATFATADANMELAQLLWLTYALLLRLVDPEIALPSQWFAEKRRIARLLRAVRELQRTPDGEPVAKEQIAAKTGLSEDDLRATMAVCKAQGVLARVDREHVKLTEEGWSSLTAIPLR